MSVRLERAQLTKRRIVMSKGTVHPLAEEGRSQGRRPMMAWWGWLATLAVPAWLVWVTVIGYRQHMACLEGLFAADIAEGTSPDPDACDRVPVAWSPTRGLELGAPSASGELWVAGLVIAVTLAALVVGMAVRAGRTRHHDG